MADDNLTDPAPYRRVMRGALAAKVRELGSLLATRVPAFEIVAHVVRELEVVASGLDVYDAAPPPGHAFDHAMTVADVEDDEIDKPAGHGWRIVSTCPGRTVDGAERPARSFVFVFWERT